MGSLQYPRVYFTGNQYWNPNTVNNNDYGGDPPTGINTYDPPKAQLNWDYLSPNGVNSFEEFPAFAAKNLPYNTPKRKLPPAEWGLYGGQQCGFVTADTPVVEGPFSVPAQKTLTTGCTNTNGEYLADPAIEPWLNQPIQLEGSAGGAKLVDVNPASFWSSQVFADQFTLGMGQTGFSAPPVARMHSRFISLSNGVTRNYNSTNDLVIAADYGAIFQTCFEKHCVEFQGAGGPLQQQIEQGFKEGAEGLMLRYSAYSTLYFQGSVFDGMPPGNRYPMLEKMGELYEQYARGELDYTPISRAYSRVVGWIGLWMPGEMVSVPGGRFLIPFDQSTNPNKSIESFKVTPSNLTANQYEPPPKLPENTDAPVHPPQALGPATVEALVNPQSDIVERLTLDLGNTFPERDSSGIKADFGVVKLALVVSGSTIQTWNVSYDQATYEQYGGLVDLPGNGLLSTSLNDGYFVLLVQSGQQGSTTEVTALVETLVTAQTDTRGMYAEQPNPSFSDGNVPSPGPGMPSTQPTCQVNVRYKGYAPQDYPGAQPSLKMTWQAFDYQLNSYSSEDAFPIAVNYYNNACDQFLPFQGAIDVPADGNVQVQVISKADGAIPNLVFLPYSTEQGGYAGAPFFPPFGIGSSYYTVIKCLNWDNTLAEWFDTWLAREKPSIDHANQTVWNQVFNTYFYVFPVMDFIANPSEFCQRRCAIQEYTDPAKFDTACYMPVSRTWTAGQRHMMNSYVNYVNSHGGKKSAFGKKCAFGKKSAFAKTSAFASPPPSNQPKPNEPVTEARAEKTFRNLGHG